MPTPLTIEQRDSLYAREEKIIPRPKKANGPVAENLTIINSITKKEFEFYEAWRRQYGGPGTKKTWLLRKMNAHGITGKSLVLAKLRVADLYGYQKVIQAIRYRFYDKRSSKVAEINSDSNKFWRQVAAHIRGRKNEKHVEPMWLDSNGLELCANYLENLYKLQNGLCAITKLPMELEIGTGDINVLTKASPDRIDSSKGYEFGNIQLTLKWVNIMKLNYSTDEFISKITLLYNSFAAKLDK
jgi:hypothetical protein